MGVNLSVFIIYALFSFHRMTFKNIYMHCIDLFFKVKVIFVHIYFFKIIYPSFFMHVSVTLQVISSANFINTLFTPICRQLMQILSTTIPNLNPFLIQLIFLENKIALLIIAPHLQFFYQFFFFSGSTRMFNATYF